MSDTAATGETVRMATYETLVLESIVETPDTRTLVLDVGTASLRWRAGQYVTIEPHQFPALRSVIAYLEQQKGRKEAPRAYSMSSAPQDPYLAVTIKEEVFEPGRSKYPPLISGYLVHQVRSGDAMTVRGFAGAYTLPDDVEARTGHILHLCAGSGSVPNVSMIRDSLRCHARLRHTLLYSNKTWQDVIFRDDLARLAAAHADRLQLVHTLTRETGPLPAGVRAGRADVELIASVLAREPDSLIYACGPAITVWDRRAHAAQGTTPPPQFLEAMLAHLDALGVSRTQVKIEAFG